MFIFGKNFLKDTVVVFQQNSAKAQPIWEEKVLPDKDSLQPVSGHVKLRHIQFCLFEFVHLDVIIIITVHIGSYIVLVVLQVL